MTTTKLDTNKIYSHDEILGYIHEENGTFNMIYEIESVACDKNIKGKMTVCAINVLIEYKGITYECDHLWFDTKTARDETIRVSRVHRRKKGGARGTVRELNNVGTTTYKGRNGETRYCIYIEPAEDGPNDYIFTTLAYANQQAMNPLKEKLLALGLSGEEGIE